MRNLKCAVVVMLVLPWAVTEAQSETPTLSLVADRTTIAPGESVTVTVFATSVADLRAYEVALAIDGGAGGTLVVEDMTVDDRTDGAFAGLSTLWDVNATDWRAGATTSGGEAVSVGTVPAYLATVSLRASADASGTFELALDPAVTIVADTGLNRVAWDGASLAVDVVALSGPKSFGGALDAF